MVDISGTYPDNPREARSGQSGDRLRNNWGRRAQFGTQRAATPVNIVEGQQEFFDGLKAAFGTGSTSGAGGISPSDFRVLIASSQATAQATKETAQEMKAAVVLLRDIGAQSATQHVQNQANAQSDQVQMSMLINYLQNVGGGGGGGGGGHGGHGGGGTGFWGSGGYGSVGQSVRAGAANWFNQNHGTPSARRHHSAATLAQLAQNTKISQALQHGGVRAAARLVPGVGPMLMTAEGVNQGAEWMTNQRAKNAYYQSIYGGENNAGGFGQGLNALIGGQPGEITGGLGNRMAEEGFVLSNRFSAGGMTEDQSRESFKGVSQLGYTGQRRNESLDFIGEQYKKLGMDIQQSLSIVQLSAKYAQGNLGGVASQLQGVTKAAQATGQSAAQLQQAFIGNYDAALRGGAGGQAAGLAGAMTSVTGGAARDLGGFSFGGMFSNPTTQYALGAQVGMTPGQVQSQSAQGNLTPQLLGASRLTNQFMGSVLGAGLQQRLQQLIEQAGGKEKVMASPGTMDNIAIQLMGDRTWDVIAVRRALQSAGISVPDDASDQQVAKFYVSWYAGNNFENEAKKNIAASTIKPVSKSEMDSRNDDKSKFPGMSNFTSEQFGKTAEMQNGVSFLGNMFNSDAAKSADTQENSTKYYADYQKTHGNVSDPAMEALIKGFGSDPSVRIRVRSKDGKDKAVTVADAIRYYGDQISTGSAYMISNNPDTNGKKLGELPGITPDAGAKAGQGGLGDSAKDSSYGDNADQYVKDNPLPGAKDTSTASGDGKVTVTLQPDVARLFQFSGTGVNINSGPNARPPAITSGPK